jgi:dihydroxynaphthoic acid synthetase
MDYQDLLYEIHDGAATITLNRPEKLNAFRNQTLIELTKALAAAIKDRSVGVIVIAGAGGKAFSVGGDISEMNGLNRKSGRIFVQNLLKLGKIFLTCPKPIVAKVNGYCIGGGNEIQLFCDLTIASDRSVFGQTGPKVGSAPLWGGTQILPLLVGLKKAKGIIFLCKQYSAAEAFQMGLINQVVPESELDQTVETICKEILAKSPQSLRLVKRALHRNLFTTLQKDLADLAKIYGTAELAEGMNAFLEKRRPDFSRFR